MGETMSTQGLALMKLTPLSSDQSGLTVNQAVSGVCRGSRTKTPGPDFGCEMKTKRRMLHLKELRGQNVAHRQKLGCVFGLSLRAALGLQDELILNDTQILT